MRVRCGGVKKEGGDAVVAAMMRAHIILRGVLVCALVSSAGCCGSESIFSATGALLGDAVIDVTLGDNQEGIIRFIGKVASYGACLEEEARILRPTLSPKAPLFAAVRTQLRTQRWELESRSPHQQRQTRRPARTEGESGAFDPTARPSHIEFLDLKLLSKRSHLARNSFGSHGLLTHHQPTPALPV